MKIDKIQLEKRVAEGLITKRKHPTQELYIYNYTPMCQFGRNWDEYTMMCRGLILDFEYNVVCRPFKKFFNLEEMEGTLPNGDFEVTEKVDGSLGILYWVDDVPYIATRGSFESEQAIKGTEILHKLKEYWGSFNNQEFTFLFEIIYPENRIVVDYGGIEDLVLLAVINRETGEELDIDMLHNDLPFHAARKHYGIKDINILKNGKEENKEGYVIKWKNGLRLKIKFEEYVRLHRLVTGVNERRIWDILRNGESLDELLDRVPDEFYNWVKETKENLEKQFRIMDIQAMVLKKDAEKLDSRKDQALFIISQNKQISGAVFNLLDGKEKKAKDYLWKLLKPKVEKGFKMIV